MLGWYERDVTLGLLMTEIGQADTATIATIIKKISAAVQNAVSPEKYSELTMMFRVFPQEVTELSDNEVSSSSIRISQKNTRRKSMIRFSESYGHLR